MSLVTYSLQSGIALALMYLFYRVFLLRLTFYRANRLYLLGYTLLALAVPFYNTGRVLPEKTAQLTVAYSRVTTALSPQTTAAVPGHSTVPLDWTWCILLAGMAVMLVRLLVQVFSLARLWREATLVGHAGGVRIYRLPYPLAPFSFGANIFVSPETEVSPDLPRIIEHEQVHIRQAHTFDILLGQLLLVLQWWNPCVWLLDRSIRQNLEYLADQGVLDQGADRKHYQYLLLGVSGIGVPALSNPLNFSPLKNRITMMNKKRSARRAGARFLFALPLLVVLLVAAGRYPGRPDDIYHLQGFVVNTHTYQPLADVLVRDEISGKTATTGTDGYFRIDFPRGPETLKLKISVTGTGLMTSEWGMEISPLQKDKTDEKSFQFVGLSPVGTETQSFVSGTNTDNPNGMLRKDPAVLKAAFDKAVGDRKEAVKVEDVFDSSPNIYYVIDGKSYIVSAPGGFASWDEVVDLVLVNGKTLMTGEELNKRYNKHQVRGEAAYGPEKAQEKFGIAKTIFSVTIDTTASL